MSTLDAAPSPPMLRSWVPLRGGTCAGTDPRRSGLVPGAAPGKADMPGGFMQVATAARLLSRRRAAAGDGETPGWAGGQLTCMPPEYDAAGVRPQLPPSAAKVGMWTWLPWQFRRASMLFNDAHVLSPLSSESSHLVRRGRRLGEKLGGSRVRAPFWLCCPTARLGLSRHACMTHGSTGCSNESVIQPNALATHARHFDSMVGMQCVITATFVCRPKAAPLDLRHRQEAITSSMKLCAGSASP